MSARNVYDENFIKPLKIAIFQVLPLQFLSETLDSVDTAEWGALPLERFLFVEIKTIILRTDWK